MSVSGEASAKNCGIVGLPSVLGAAAAGFAIDAGLAGVCARRGAAIRVAARHALSEANVKRVRNMWLSGVGLHRERNKTADARLVSEHRLGALDAAHKRIHV